MIKGGKAAKKADSDRGSTAQNKEAQISTWVLYRHALELVNALGQAVIMVSGKGNETISTWRFFRNLYLIFVNSEFKNKNRLVCIQKILNTRPRQRSLS